MAWHRSADQDGPKPFRGPPVMRLWLSVVLLSLPGWRVPGNPIADVRSVRCPYGHGWRDRQTDHSARCDDCPQGWFLWTRCPLGEHLVASDSGSTWRCNIDDTHLFDARLCPACWSLGARQDDDSWRCTFDQQFFWTARRNCDRCRFGTPVFLAGGHRWVCPACGFWEDAK